jgi:hypothetical protein
MLLKAQVITGILKLATRPATDNRLFSTCRTLQKWTRADMEIKYYTDPEWRRRMLDRTEAARLRRLQNSSEPRDRNLATAKAWRLRNSNDSFKRLARLRKWCYVYDWVRDQLPWKAYKPELYESKVQHHCTGCVFIPKTGYKLWWRHINRSVDHEQPNPGPESTSATEKYMCSACYLKAGWENITPQGFEDVTTIKELRIRAKELDIDIGEGMEQEKHVSIEASQTQNATHEPRTRGRPGRPERSTLRLGAQGQS